MPKNVTTNMMDNLFNSDPTNFEETPFHLITTDHPYMAMLGLSAFTTGTLYRWIEERDGQGELANKKYFDKTYGDFDVEMILTGDTTSVSMGELKIKSSDMGKRQYAFQAWRKEGDAGAGKYHTKYADAGHSDLWNFAQGGVNEAGDPRAYNHDDLNTLEFHNKYMKPDGTLAGGTDGDTTGFEVPDGKGGEEEIEFFGVNTITDIITMNDYVNKLDLETIDKSSWTKEQFARSEFILDIQSSKEGYVEWSGYVPFQIRLGEGDDGDTFECAKSDWVKYRLYLYPNGTPKSTRRGIAMAKPAFAGPPVDALGRKYQRKEDGRFAAFPEGSASSEVVADLDMTYNEYTGKWEAGSKQMVAVVVQQIEPAQVISTERIRNLSPEEMLKNPTDPNSHIIWGSGGAIPFSMQNANPQQWTPNYAQASELDEDGNFTIICPKETDEKATLRVFNASSKALEVDQYVLLNQIDGIWFAIDFPSGVLASDEIEASFDGLWEFQYVATNVVNYMRSFNFQFLHTEEVEQRFHMNYYEDDVLNSGTYPRWISPSVDGPLYKIIQPGGFHQFTSWDFMDDKIAGTRENYNAYSLTNPLEAANGDSLIPQLDQGGDTYSTESFGARTGGFFGCLFPDGYNTQDIATYKVARDFVATPTVAASSINEAGKWDSQKKHGLLYASLSKMPYGDTDFSHEMVYFGENGIQKDGLPFNDGDARNGWKYLDQSYRDSQGNYINMFDDGDASVSHLPADIALNASPAGAKNGQPLTSLHFVEAMYNTRNFGGDLECHENVVRLFSEGKNWLYKKYDDGDDNAEDFVESSAFDFKPNRPNRIMFRPLKAEAYAQFGSVEYDADVAADSNARVKSRQGFNQAISSRLSDQKRPSSKSSYEREYNVDFGLTQSRTFGGFGIEGTYGYTGDLGQLYQSFWGLQNNIDIPPHPYPNTYKISPNASLDSVGARHPSDHWGAQLGGNQWCHGAVDWANDVGGEGGLYRTGTDPVWRELSGHETSKSGGVGIIGAVATFGANKSVKFSSDCRVGTQAWNNINAGQDGYTFYASWGGAGAEKITTFGTTHLFAKIFHSWPREQTVYDSRYFAIHHFNAGILGERDGEGKYTNRVEIEKITQTDPNDPNGGEKQYDYEIHQSDYDIDLRMPSYLQKNPVEDGTNVLKHVLGGPTTVKAYKNRVVDNSVVYETLPYNKWDIDTQRRGKLLPYRYSEHTISIPAFKVSIPRFDDGKDADGVEQVYKNGGYAVIINLQAFNTQEQVYLATATPFYDISSKERKEFDPLTRPDTDDVVMIIKNPGSGPTSPYKKGDTFVTGTTLSTVQAIIEVLAVEEGTDDDDGRIAQLKVSFAGSGFGYSGFSSVDEDTPISSVTTGMGLTGGGSQPPTGGGFNAYLVRGTKTQAIVSDDKPAVATSADVHRLSIASLQKGQSDTREGIGPFRDVEEQEIILDNKSSDGKYDVFFHFHNDVSHTFMLGRDGMNREWHASANRPKGEENWIDLTITTD